MNHLLLRWLAGLAFLSMLLTSCQASPSGTAHTDGDLPQLVNKGSDTMVNLALAWAEAYQSENPNVRLSVTGGGSGTGLAALLNNTVDIANASRKMKAEEFEQAHAKGLDPVEFVVARDAIAVIVNPANPIERLTLTQVRALYSGAITNWRDVGGLDAPVVLLSRETNSGTHVYFLEEVLRLGQKGDKTLFSTDTLLMPSSEGITVEVRQNPYAIGYDGLGYVTADVKVLAIAHDDASPYILPSAETVNRATDRYPIARDLYMYTANPPTGAIQDYLNWILSAEAQAIVTRLGFVPLK